MKTLRTNSLMTLALCLFLAGMAVAGNVEKEMGYVDLEWITIPDGASEFQDIDLGPILGNLAKDAESKGDDALVQALAMVRSIRVKAYSIDDDTAAEAEKSVESVRGKLKKDGWKNLFNMKDGDETVLVTTRYDGEDMVGLMIVTYEPGDSVAFVNVVGDLDLGTLLSLAQKIDHDSIEDMLEELDGVEGIEIDTHDSDEDDD